MIKKIIMADVLGFCMGVERAVNILNDLSNDNKDITINTLGPIIHNIQVVDKFIKKGISPVNYENINDNSKLVIRAHGIPIDLQNKIESNKSIQLINATCPNVIASHKIIKKYSDQGYQILIFGDAEHGEVIGLESYAKDSIIISSVEDAEKCIIKHPSLLICQTTVKESEFNQIKNILLSRDKNITIKNTICSATGKRQEALKKILFSSDAIVVIGSTGSANTNRLAKTAIEANIPTFIVEHADSIPNEVFDYETVGITAGASTPDWLIESIIKKLKSES